MPREYKTYAVTLDQGTRDLLDDLMDRLSLPTLEHAHSGLRAHERRCDADHCDRSRIVLR